MMRHPRGFVAGGILQSLATAVIGVLVLGTLSYASEAIPEMQPLRVEEEGEFTEPRPDPRQCKDAARQASDLVREVTRMQKLLVKAKLSADAESLGALIATAKQHAANIKADCSQENLQEFWDAQLWEELNAVRCKAELPQQITQIEREMKKLDAKTFPKRLTASGIDAATFASHLATAKQAAADARAALASGTCEDANEAMQAFWQDGLHPGEMMGVVMRLAEILPQVKRVKSEEIRSAIMEVLEEVIAAANEGDFRDANMALNDIQGELMRFLGQVRGARGFSDAYRKKLDALEQKIGAKIEPDMPSEQYVAPPSQIDSAQPAPAPTTVEPTPAPATAPSGSGGAF